MMEIKTKGIHLFLPFSSHFTPFLHHVCPNNEVRSTNNNNQSNLYQIQIHN